jgi:hypothetical protein
MFADYDGRAADAEHQRQQRRHVYVVYVSLHVRHARFAMPAMFGASTAEVRCLLISSHDSGGPGGGTFASLAIPHLLIPGFLHFTSGLGALKVC